MPGSDWEGELGDCNFEGINVSVPWSLACLSQRLEPRMLDLSGMGPGIDVCEQRMQPDPEDDTNPVGVNGVKSVNGMLLKVFWRKLVNHFKILFPWNEIKWPVRRPINSLTAIRVLVGTKNSRPVGFYSRNSMKSTVNPNTTFPQI